MKFKDEKIFKGEKEIKYLFKKSYRKTNDLVIIFSAFPAIGKEPAYNYVRTLDEFDCNKLYILDDFGVRATYYLCKNKDFNIERSVITLINQIVEENGIKNIMACGSSKGGYAALYYGIKYGFKDIVIASPQYFLGDYLLTQTNSQLVVEFMAGNTTEKDHKFLNNILKDIIRKSEYKPNIFIHVGKGEYHYPRHIIPLLKELESNEKSYELDLGDYDNHNQVIKYYPTILKNKVRQILDYPHLELLMDSTEYRLGNTITIKANTLSKNDSIAWYIYKDNVKIQDIKYSENQKQIDLKLDKIGSYKVKVFAINKKKNKVQLSSELIEVK
ncbi:YqiA/YcfP family alpha/beta fold hydrolase [Alkalihalobacillus sp. 1P02AB]|uniref:YqiA/YcfP family alpha/beta fold hydrolase n=1 Tax=Alkalihalobacillus sp. 1P02AB TaxID=3132260 RepID=UPI0039A6D873